MANFSGLGMRPHPLHPHAVRLGACAYSGLQDRILLNYTRIENARKVLKKTIVFFSVYVDVRQTFTVVFLFPC